MSLTLSDSFCVHRHLEEFRALVTDDVDLLFANEEEIFALTDTRDIAAAAAAVRGRSEIVVITRSEHGSMVVTADDTVEVPAAPVERLVTHRFPLAAAAEGFRTSADKGTGSVKVQLVI